MNCDFRAYDVCTNFRGGLLHRRRRTEEELLMLVIFYRTMLRRAGYEIACRLSVSLSVRDVEVCFSYSLEYFENNFTAK